MTDTLPGVPPVADAMEIPDPRIALMDRFNRTFFASEPIGPTGQFRFDGKASIEHMNIRKVGDEDDLRLAIDAKFDMLAPFDAILPFCDPVLALALFIPDTGAVANIFLQPLAFDAKLKRYRIEAAGMWFGDASLSKFAFKPIDRWAWRVSFTASFEPSETEVAVLAEHLRDELSVDIGPLDAELALPDPNPGAH